MESTRGKKEMEDMKREGSEEMNASKKTSTEKKHRYKNTIHLWEFLLELLADDRYKSLITWSRKDYGEFKLKNQEEVAKRWGILKHRAGMNYEKLSRAIRYYYQQGIIKKVPGQRLVYKFGKLPYEFKPRITRMKEEKEIKPRAITQSAFKELKSESPAFLPLTSLTPPPEVGYHQCAVIPSFTRPACTCYDCLSACAAVHASSVLFPTGYTYCSPIVSPVRSIPVSVITSTNL